MLLNGPTLMLPLIVVFASGEIFDFDNVTNTAEITEAMEEVTEKELREMSNVSCSKYFDKYCLSPKIYKHCTTCGIQKIYQHNGIINKIYGGRESVPHSWPWMASLYESVTQRWHANGTLQNKTHSKIICAASLISEKHAITATHCLLDRKAEKNVKQNRWYLVKETLSTGFFLRFADHHRNDWKFESQVDVPIQGFTIYKSSTDDIDGDVAILELEWPVDFTPKVHPVCLPPPNLDLEEETKCMAVGWGLLNRLPPIQAPTLQETEMRIISPILCVIRSQTFQVDMHVCAYEPEKGVLNGDSGGGLYCKIHPDDEQWYLYGVTSFSWLSTGVSGFSRVPYYVDWIHKMIK
ncbi:unnamed protein product [Hymenolepis diminuta]|uniref:Peptidase S1 domain-containing protein n=1 Tax=Hymenolepis diminuta TaxID=6216 RepID=A0A0R3SVQ8_HYMDI|nr:unnamed protein product [Hymenolepis diminuta]